MDTIDVYARGQRKTVLQLPGDTLRSPIYAPPGYLLYTRETTSPGVWAVRFSLDTLQTVGEPFMLVARARWPSIAADGTIAILRPPERPPARLDRAHRRDQPVMSLPGPFSPSPLMFRFAASPNGRRLAMSILGVQGEEAWAIDLERRDATRLSVGAQLIGSLAWSNDGLRVLLGAFVGGRTWNLFSVPSSEAGQPEPLLPPGESSRWPTAMAADGKTVIFGQFKDGQTDLWLAHLDAPGGRVEPLIATPFNESDARLSPDGRLLAYVSDETGRYDVYVRGFPIGTDRIRVSTGGGSSLVWSADGSQIYFRSGDDIMAATVSMRGTSSPVRVFSLPPGIRAVPCVRGLARREQVLLRPAPRGRPGQRDAQLAGRPAEEAVDGDMNETLRSHAAKTIVDLRALAALTSTAEGAQRIAWAQTWRDARAWFRQQWSRWG